MNLIAIVLILLSSLFFVLTVFFLLKYQSQKPEAQLRKRLNDMIEAAEAERAKNPKLRKNKTPTTVNINQPAEQRPRRRLDTFYERAIRPIITSIEERFQKFTPNEIKMQLEDKIFRAGKMGIWDIKKLISAWCLSIVACTLLAFLSIYGADDIHPLQKIFVIGLGIFMGATVPFAVLNSKIRQRQRSIRKQLPEFLDILCVSVQAGLSFDGAIGKMVRRMQGPLIDEFRRAQNDVALGMTHQYALTNLAKRCDLEEVYLFTTSVIQAEKLGTSMTRTLKVQADNMRDRHRQHVKAEALKAPVKIIFPMVLFIFPSIFVILLFPALLTIVRALGSG